MFHLAGYSEANDTAVLDNIAALQDQSLQVNGDSVIVPDDLSLLLGFYGLGPNLTREQLVSPSIRRTFPQEVYRLDLSATPTDQLLVNWLGQSAMQLDSGEQLQALMAEGGAGATRGTLLVWFGDNVPQPVAGDIHTIRISSAVAAVANVWSNITLTFNDVLPAGQYALVGATLQSTNGQAFRFVFKGGSYRPGWLMNTTLAQRQHDVSRFGGLGNWGTFSHLTPPSVDVLCNGADAAFQGAMDVIYLGR